MNQNEDAKNIANRRYHVPNLARALQVLEHLATCPTGLGVSEIASQLKQPKNSVFRIVTTLSDYGYLDRDDVQKTYRVSRKVMALGYEAMEAGGLVQRSLETMRRLRDTTGETVLIGILADDAGVVLEQVASRQAVKVHVEIGHRFPLQTAAPAKAMLAFLPTAEQERLISGIEFHRHTEASLLTPEAYSAELREIRSCGYALDRGEELADLACVAAPLWDRHGDPRASIWVTGPRSRLTDARWPETGAQVLEAALEIMNQSGAQVPQQFLQAARSSMDSANRGAK